MLNGRPFGGPQPCGTPTERLAKFGLSLNAEKMRVLPFGRFAAVQRKRDGQRRPETFDFLGFMHMCATTRAYGPFPVMG